MNVRLQFSSLREALPILTPVYLRLICFCSTLCEVTYKGKGKIGQSTLDSVRLTTATRRLSPITNSLLAPLIPSITFPIEADLIPSSLSPFRFISNVINKFRVQKKRLRKKWETIIYNNAHGNISAFFSLKEREK